MKKILGLLLIVGVLMGWSAGDVQAQSCTHYAANNGTGSTCTIGTPCLINSFWSISSLPGKVLCLNDGTYTGASSMIAPPDSVQGTSGNPITVRALNDGQVLIDGQTARPGIYLNSTVFGGVGNNWFVIDGINVTNGRTALVDVRGTDNIISRVIAYNGWDGDQNSFAFDITGDRSRAVDCGGWGMNMRKIFNMSQAGDANGAGYKRCWGEWNDHPQGGSNPNNGFQIGYNTVNALAENVLITWNTLGDIGNTEGALSFFNANNTVPAPGPTTVSRVLGSVAYVRASATYSAGQVVFGHNHNYVTAVDVAMIVGEGDTSVKPYSMRTCSIGWPACNNSTCTNCLAVHRGTAGENQSNSGWSFVGLREGNGLAAATGGTSAFELMPGLCRRYENGVLTSTPLWPWPMDARISAARVAGGFLDLTVTTDIENVLGTIPAACRSDVGGTPQPNITGGTVQPGKETGRYGGFERQPDWRFGGPIP